MNRTPDLYTLAELDALEAAMTPGSPWLRLLATARAGLEAQEDADRLESMLQQEGGCVQVWRNVSDTSSRLCITYDRKEIDAAIAKWRGVPTSSGLHNGDPK